MSFYWLFQLLSSGRIIATTNTLLNNTDIILNVGTVYQFSLGFPYLKNSGSNISLHNIAV